MTAYPLFNQLCNSDNLWNAWLSVKKKNSAGGIDFINVKDFEPIAGSEIKKLSKEIIEGSYVPQPYKSKSIPKSANKFRTLGLLTIRDKIVQQAANSILYPIIDKELSSFCYGYRQRKGAVKAVNKVRHFINFEKNKFMVSSDIKGYFDNISHELLFEMLKPLISDYKMLDFIALCIKMGRVKSGNRWVDSNKGVPQGGIISPLLSNLYLVPLDKALLQLGVGYVRYADDFVVLTKTAEDAKKATAIINEVINQLKLQLKISPEITNIEKGFEFLGITFTTNGMLLGDAKKARMIEKINKSFENLNSDWIKTLMKIIVGYKAFYCKVLTQKELVFLDEHLLKKLKERTVQEKIKNKSSLYKYLDGFNFVTDIFEKDKKKILDKLFDEHIQPKEKKADNKHVKLIAKRKKEYQKLEAQGKEIIINTFGTYLGISSGKISIKTKEHKKQLLPFTNLSHITILTNGVSLSSDFLFHCSQNHLPVSFFTRTGKHYASIYTPFVTDSSLWQDQLAFIKNEKASQLAAIFIEGKIRNQVNLMKYYNKYHKTSDAAFAKKFNEKIGKLQMESRKCRFYGNNSDDNYRQTILGIESQAALIYWELVVELINDDSDFSGRVRRGAKDLVNSLFNYGYAILYTRVWKALLAAKLNPHISFLHVPSTNKPTLAFDFIELFRQQAVDRVVISMLQKKEKLTISNGFLDEPTRAKLTEKIYERLHRYEKFRGENRTLYDIIKIQAYSLARFIKGEIKTFKPYIAKW